ncbi:aldo/keto reductase [Chloroflexota bacterium]
MRPNSAVDTEIISNTEIGVGAWAWGDRFYWNYGGSYNKDTVGKMFHASLENGINFFDTAEVYGQGRSEQILGELIRKAKKPVMIATKFFPYPWRINERSIEKALDKSLERLQLDKVYLYQIHWPRSLISIEKMMRALLQIVDSGKSITVGVSNFNLAQTKIASEILESNGIPLASNQLEYHLLNRQIENNGLLDFCNEKKIRVIAYSPLAQGLLSGKYSIDSPPPGIRSSRYSNQLKILNPLISVMKEISISQGKSISQVALNWLICKKTLPIPGAKNLDQLISNNNSAGWRLSTSAMSILDKASDAKTTDS